MSQLLKQNKRVIRWKPKNHRRNERKSENSYNVIQQ